MAVNRVNPRAVKLHRSYSVSELAACFGGHKNTVRHWQPQGACIIVLGDHARGMLRELDQIEVATLALAQRLRLQLAGPIKIPHVTVRRRRRSHAA